MPHVAPCLPHVLPLVDLCQQLHLLLLPFLAFVPRMNRRVLDHDDRVGAEWERRAGVDAVDAAFGNSASGVLGKDGVDSCVVGR